MSVHGASSVRRDLPSKPIELRASYAQRGGAYAIEASRVSGHHEVPVTGDVSGWRDGCQSQARQLQWGHVSRGVEVHWAQSVTHGTDKLEGRMVRSPNSYSPQ